MDTSCLHQQAHKFLDAAWSLNVNEELQPQWDAVLREWEKSPTSLQELCMRTLAQQGENSPCWAVALAAGFLFMDADQ